MEGKPIYLICGARRAGKDTLAKRYVAQGYTHFKFAGALKDALKAMYNFTDAQLEDDTKELIDPRWGISPRYAMTSLGTDLVQSYYGNTFWCKRLAIDIDKCTTPIVISDLRFHHEVDYMRERYGDRITIILVTREGMIIPAPTHVSEMEWCSIKPDIVHNA